MMYLSIVSELRYEIASSVLFAQLSTKFGAKTCTLENWPLVMSQKCFFLNFFTASEQKITLKLALKNG